MGAPLEDARLLTYRYERIRHDVEAQVKSSSNTNFLPVMFV